MVKIVAKFKILKGKEEMYLSDLKPCVLATREEPGCLEYNAFWNAAEREITLFECFVDNEAAARHLEYQHFLVNFRALKQYYECKATVERYENQLF